MRTMLDADLLTNHLFIIKRLQRHAFIRAAGFLSGRMIDIGCGSRPYRRFISGHDYVAVDESAEIHPDVRALATALPFTDGSFDSVVATEVIEHVADPRLAVNEMARVLKASGGRCYITAPQDWPLHYEPSDFWRFTNYGIESLLTGAGLKVVSVERIGGIFSVIGQMSVDFLWTALRRLFLFLGTRAAERLSTLICFPANIFFCLLSFLGDRFDKRFALGWAVVGEKR